MLQSSEEVTAPDWDRTDRPAIRWADIPAKGQRAILSLIDRLVRKIPGAIVRMTPEERVARIQARKLEILREAGL